MLQNIEPCNCHGRQTKETEVQTRTRMVDDTFSVKVPKVRREMPKSKKVWEI